MKKLLSIILACSMLMSLCFVGTVHAGWEWVDFQYVETFEDGVVPEGFTLVKASNDEGSKMYVDGGKLVVDINNPWDFTYVTFNNLGIVKRDTNLVIEMDITRHGGVAYSAGRGSMAGPTWAMNNMDSYTVGAGGGPVTGGIFLDTETNNAATSQVYRQSENGNYSLYAGTASNVEGGNLATGATVKVKYVFTPTNRNPKIYFNGVESNDSNHIMWDNWSDEEGLVGFGGRNCDVAIDNIVIKGKHYAYVPDYNSVVNYEKGAAAFAYEENFDDLPNGACPEGFKLKKADNDEGSTLAVQNGALEFNAKNPWACTYVAFENLGIVKRDTNLVIEMDLKKISGPNWAPGHAAQIGAAWTMAVEDGYAASYVPVTGTTTLDAEDTTEGQLYYQREINPNDGAPYSGRATNFTGANLASGEVVKVKYVFSQNNRNAKVFFNGVESNSGNIMWNNWTANEGYVGLCGMNGKFAIDNIKITGYNYGSGSSEAAIEATTYAEYAEQFDTYKNEAGADCYTSAVKAAFNVSNLKNAVSTANVWFAGADAAAEIKLNTAIESAKGVEIALNVRYVPTDVELTVEKIELN